ncbi:hypothetical protein [Allorhizocola rhizosphaerae]|uniref:hypothetical protein n=1 Tax=Allorhizocola rhizosphaerae TaxID=1872709 RepID=UPI0013C310EE|nr:hypothetical protein [Allorhizocola rhizosphaerae]
MSSPSSAPAPSPCAGTVRGGPDHLRGYVEDWLCGRRTLPEVPLDIDMTWTFVECDGAAGSSYCSYRNGEGSDLILRVPNAQPETVTEVRVDRTTFAADADEYARQFVEAWVNGNQPRVRALSTPEVAAFTAGNPPPESGYEVVLSPSEVPEFEVRSSGSDYLLIVRGRLGRPNAITNITGT